MGEERGVEIIFFTFTCPYVAPRRHSDSTAFPA